ncbi:polyisoprenyl-phosphate glycosyltransferase [Cytobacillus horneckiae]|nr:glycosyltransferase family 2 protein [Cytobacillus horneckiae]MBN6885147.1 glycosyltransferase family 2 protein [Cytobacillus horneckiae]MCM3179101.1 glycosyltransferase family 2 protein [Cytobacillus horneckiae]MEC1154325.1 glycosyltransferase family 2 protein [Cytobacillus horneckiae]MED2937661.1 glycosyltransferase family 2 protein [Cytobacillus horneckiae]
MENPVLTIVVPCFNEQEVLPETMKQLNQFLTQLIVEELVSEKSKVLFIDDGSKDDTWTIIYKYSLNHRHIRGLKLSRNAGHQNALLAGLFTAVETSDCLISIDADLQDDIHVMKEFIMKYHEGNEIVYGVRKKRDSDTFFKRSTAQAFYKLMKIMGTDLIYNHADFRLMSKRAVHELKHFSEINMFLRGIVPLIGFKSANVYYDRKERLAGETKYPINKMLAFSLEGITSFSVTPIRLVVLIGFLTFFISIMFGVYFLSLKFSGRTELGWTSLIASIWLIGGLQLIAIGLIGEYIGKIYKESKRRPKYIIDIDTLSMPIPHHLINDEGKYDEHANAHFRNLPETN